MSYYCENCEDRGEAVEAELESVKATLAAVIAWQQKGEHLITSNHRGVMFELGEWWADRPWRKREN